MASSRLCAERYSSKHTSVQSCSINVFYVTVWCLEVISFVFHSVKCSSADGAVVLKKPCVSCCNTLPHWVKKTHFPSTQLPDCFRLVVQAESYLLSDHHSLDLELLVHKDLPRYFELSMFKSAICGIALTHQWLSILTVWCQVRRWGYVTSTAQNVPCPPFKRETCYTSSSNLEVFPSFTQFPFPSASFGM